MTNTAHAKLKNWLQNFISHGEVTIGGQTHQVPLFDVQQVGDVITVYLYLADNYQGTITRVRLYDRDGDLFDDRTENASKPTTQGFLAAFQYTVRRV